MLAAILALEKTSHNSAPVLFEVMLQSVMSNSIHVTDNVIPLCLEYFFTPQIFFLHTNFDSSFSPANSKGISSPLAAVVVIGELLTANPLVVFVSSCFCDV